MVGQYGCQMGFSSPGQPKKQDVVGWVDEIAPLQLGDLTTDGKRHAFLLKGAERFANRQVSPFKQSLDPASFSPGHFLFQQVQQEGIQGPIFSLGQGDSLLNHLRDGRQA